VVDSIFFPGDSRGAGKKKEKDYTKEGKKKPFAGAKNSGGEGK
jgi:hypothetical protein